MLKPSRHVKLKQPRGTKELGANDGRLHPQRTRHPVPRMHLSHAPRQSAALKRSSGGVDSALCSQVLTAWHLTPSSRDARLMWLRLGTDCTSLNWPESAREEDFADILLQSACWIKDGLIVKGWFHRRSQVGLFVFRFKNISPLACVYLKSWKWVLCRQVDCSDHT